MQNGYFKIINIKNIIRSELPPLALSLRSGGFPRIMVKQGETKVNNTIINSYDPNDTAETEGARYVVYNSSNNPFISINRLNGDITITPTKHDKPGKYRR